MTPDDARRELARVEKRLTMVARAYEWAVRRGNGRVASDYEREAKQLVARANVLHKAITAATPLDLGSCSLDKRT